MAAGSCRSPPPPPPPRARALPAEAERSRSRRGRGSPTPPGFPQGAPAPRPQPGSPPAPAPRSRGWISGSPRSAQPGRTRGARGRTPVLGISEEKVQAVQPENPCEARFYFLHGSQRSPTLSDLFVYVCALIHPAGVCNPGSTGGGAQNEHMTDPRVGSLAGRPSLPLPAACPEVGLEKLLGMEVSYEGRSFRR
ncbi:atherin-like [Pteropus medius]|uniref:atherin-like n=1 Tax=Pteropus vampyrus TaxID=132908 RepID=UPI00196B4C5C|nr:atherin-like [Pteropus giganteus]